MGRPSGAPPGGPGHSDLATPGGHVPALDGIRAVAVLSVLAFHGGVAWLPGGFLGVDAFFVLSGYLITSLLLAEWVRRDGRIDLVGFWGRRARRLLPALLLVLVTVAVVGRQLLPPEELRLMRGDGIAALLYVANWRMLFRGSDYFAQTAAPSPLEHTWSLGIEEQFYLVWPLLLVLVLGLGRVRGDLRRRLRALLVLCGVGAVASTVALAAAYVPDDPDRAYYGTDTRGAGLLIGAGLAALLALREHRQLAAGTRRTALGACAAVAVVVGLAAATRLAGTDDLLYRGGFAAFSLAVAVVLAHALLVPGGWSARVLSLPPLPALGRVSYGVYLWHWPVFLAVNGARTGLEGLPLLGLRSAVTLVLAVASYVLVERPVRTRLRPRRASVAVAVTGMALAGVATAVVVATAVPPLPGRPADASVGDAVERFLQEGAEADEWAGERAGERGAVRRTRDPLHRRAPGEVVVVDVFGDSVAWTLVTYLPDHPELDVRDRTLMGCGVARTAPFRYADRVYPQLAPTCRDWPRAWRAAVARDDPDVAFILVGRWETMDRVLEGRWTHVGESAYDAYLRAELRLAIRLAGAGGAHVLLATEPYNRRWERLDGSLYPEDQPERVTAWNRLLRDVAAEWSGVRVVELGERISPGGRFSWTAGGYQVRSDGLHLTPSGVQQWIAPWLLPQLVDAVPPA